MNGRAKGAWLRKPPLIFVLCVFLAALLELWELAFDIRRWPDSGLRSLSASVLGAVLFLTCTSVLFGRYLRNRRS